MSMIYNRYELLELFDEEKMLESDAGVIEYRMEKENHILILYIDTYDESLIAKLTSKSLIIPLFEIVIHNVKRIMIDKAKTSSVFVKIFKDDRIEIGPECVILISPNFGLSASL